VYFDLCVDVVCSLNLNLDQNGLNLYNISKNGKLTLSRLRDKAKTSPG
jgi:hypothetical protein